MFRRLDGGAAENANFQQPNKLTLLVYEENRCDPDQKRERTGDGFFVFVADAWPAPAGTCRARFEYDRRSNPNRTAVLDGFEITNR